MKYNALYVSSVALILIAGNTFMSHFRPNQTIVIKEVPAPAVVLNADPVVQILDTVVADSSDPVTGATGFLVKDGTDLKFVPCDPKSRLGLMKDQKFLRKRLISGEIHYEPLFSMNSPANP